MLCLNIIKKRFLLLPDVLIVTHHFYLNDGSHVYIQNSLWNFPFANTLLLNLIQTLIYDDDGYVEHLKLSVCAGFQPSRSW